MVFFVVWKLVSLTRSHLFIFAFITIALALGDRPKKTMVQFLLCLKGQVRDILMRTSLVVEWVRLQASTAGGTGSIPGQGTKIPHTHTHTYEMY